MKWYNYMTKQEKRNFQKVIAVCVVGAILILPICLKVYSNLRNIANLIDMCYD